MNWTLYEALQWEKSDFDTSDTVYDTTVTVVYDDYSQPDNYNRFCKFILQHVKALEKYRGGYILADWTGFITENLDVFRELATEMWWEEYIPTDDDDLIYEWIKEIHGWLAGSVSETEYGIFMEKYAPRIKEV